MPEPLLRVRELTVHLGNPSSVVLNRVSFDIWRGETIAVVGKSGAGKTTLARALVGLLPSKAAVTGSIFFNGTDVLRAGERERQQLRGSGLALIRQEPELALNPVLRIRRQVEEVLRAHVRLNARQRRAEVASALNAVGLTGPAIHSAYPNQLSGGQRQRAVIAQALIAKPALLIADEPTSSLDTVTQAEIVALLRDLKTSRHLTLLFITHHPRLLGELADRTLAVANGTVVERSSTPGDRFASSAGVG